jgi:hypothetical protein
MKHLLYLVALVATISFVSCGDNEVTPDTPDNPIDNPEPTPDPDPTPEPAPEYPEGTYHFSENLSASVYTMETNGLRNDYLSFYDNVSGNTLYIDCYSESGGEELASGKYELGDGTQPMTFAQKWTYMTFSGSDDLHRFVEGSAYVVTDSEHESGYPWYHITAYFVLPDGQSVSLDYEGQIAEK